MTVRQYVSFLPSFVTRVMVASAPPLVDTAAILFYFKSIHSNMEISKAANRRGEVYSSPTISVVARQLNERRENQGFPSPKMLGFLLQGKATTKRRRVTNVRLTSSSSSSSSSSLLWSTGRDSARLSETFKLKGEGSTDPSVVVKTVEVYPVEIRAVGPS
jgi:hypothetical protein